MSTLTGFSVSPSLVSGVVLDADDFSVIAAYEKKLSADVFFKNGQLLHPTALVQAIQECKNHLQLHDGERIQLTLLPQQLGTCKLEQTDDIDRLSESLIQAIEHQNILQSSNPILQDHVLWEQGSYLGITFTGMDQGWLDKYLDAFTMSALTVQAVDLIPLCVIRSMGASGVLDALLAKIGLQGHWGCFGTSGDQTWTTFWQGNQLLYLNSFTTPPDSEEWQQMILDGQNQLGLGTPRLWLTWNEKGAVVPVDPNNLDLFTVIRPAMLGKMYRDEKDVLSFAALGAALKADVDFPLGWNLVTVRVPDGVHPAITDTAGSIPIAQIDYDNYEPLLPKLVNGMAWMALVMVILSMGILFFLDRRTDTVATGPDPLTQVEAELTRIDQNNQFYLYTLNWISGQVSPRLQLSALSVDSHDGVNLQGLAEKQEDIQAFMTRLSTASGPTPYRFEVVSSAITEPKAQKAPYGFKLHARVVPVDASKKGAKS